MLLKCLQRFCFWDRTVWAGWRLTNHCVMIMWRSLVPVGSLHACWGIHDSLRLRVYCAKNTCTWTGIFKVTWSIGLPVVHITQFKSMRTEFTVRLINEDRSRLSIQSPFKLMIWFQFVSLLLFMTLVSRLTQTYHHIDLLHYWSHKIRRDRNESTIC